MSKQVDERVVSMQFDNRQFERNVSTTMSTLDKLKQKLHLDGATKGLENIGAATKNVNMSGLSTAVETVRNRFSALEVMGVTALANISNQAVNAGKRLLESLTIAPIKDGFSEYEMTLNAIQTTMAATGKTADEVQEELKKLDEYADKTVYSTADMLNNLPKFTNAGVELETATKAMIGIANATALAGGDAGKASIAFYNLGQAIGTGYLTRMDYNSINNAGIATMEWKEQMVEAAIASGTLKKAGDDLYETGGKTFTLQQLFIDGLQHQWATTDVMLKVFGDYGDETTKIGEKAYSAAQDIKTFSMMMDSLKATAGTGWKDTWQLIFGDLDAAKELWTGLTNFVSGIITKMADIRNNFLSGALNGGSLWESITGKLDKVGLGGIKKVAETISDATDKLEYFQDIVNKVWRGDYDVAPNRYQLLEKAGYDHRVVQDLVNKGYQYKITIEDIEASHKKFGLTMDKTSESTEKTKKALGSLSDEELKNAGLTETEIRLYRDLEAESKRTGKSITELADEMSKMDGRQLIIESFKNAGKGLVTIFKSLADAWSDIFPPVSFVKIYNGIKAFNEFSKNLIVGEETAKNLTRTFKGLFAIIDIIATLAGGGLKIAFKVLYGVIKGVAEYLNMDILELTGNVADAIVKFRDWIDSILDVDGAVEFLLDLIVKTVAEVKEWYKSFKDTDTFKRLATSIAKVVEAVKGLFDVEDAGNALDLLFSVISAGIGIIGKFHNAFKETGVYTRLVDIIVWVCDSISSAINGLKETDNVPKFIIQGLVNGIKDGVSLVAGAIIDLGKGIISAICDILGIHSPSVVFFAIGGFLIAGLVNGIITGEHTLVKTLISIGKTIFNIVKNIVTDIAAKLETAQIDWGAILAVGSVVAVLAVAFKLANALEGLSSPLEGFGDVLDSVSDAIDSFSLKMKADAMLTIAKAVGILAAAVAVLSFIEPAKLGVATGVIVALGGVLAGLFVVVDKFGPDDKKKIINFSLMVVAVSAALLVVAIAMGKLSGMSPTEMITSGLVIAALGGIMVGLMALVKLIDKIGGSGSIDKIGGMMLKMSLVFLLMTFVVKQIAALDENSLKKGVVGIAAFSVIIVGLMAATKLLGGSRKIEHLGSTILKVSAAILVMTFVAKQIAAMDTESLIKGTIGIVAFSGIIVGLMAATKLLGGGKNADKIGGTILKISAALVLMSLAVKILGGMDEQNLVKGTIAIAAFTGIIVGLIAATRLASDKELKKAGSTLLAMSVAIGILAIVAALLSTLSTENLVQGITAVGVLSIMMAGLMHSLKGVENCKSTLIALSIAIGALALSVVALSFIDKGKLTTATIALGAVMGMLALLMTVSGKAKGATGSVILMLGVVAGLALIISKLSDLDSESSISSAASLSILLVAMSGVLLLLGKANVTIKDALVGVLALTAMAIPLIAFVGVLAVMQHVDKATENTLTLVTLAAAMTALLIPLSIIGALIGATGGIILLGVAALLAMAVPLIAFVGVLAVMQHVGKAEENINLLVGLMTTMTDMLLKISLVAPLAVIAVGAIAALTGVMLAVGLLAVAIGALMTWFPQLEEFLNVGIPIMERLAYAVGAMIGNLIAGFSNAIAESLPNLAMSLSLFMAALLPFITSVKIVDEQVLIGVGILTAAILLLTAADFINGIVSFLSGGQDSLPKLGASLSMFMLNAMPFILGASALNENMLKGVKMLAETILILTAADILSGLTSWFTGGASLENFGSQIGLLGSGLADFSSKLGTFTEEQLATVNCAASAIKTLAQAAQTIPNAGGLLADLVGDNELGTFASQFPILGTGLREFLTNVGTFSDDQVATVNCAADAIKTLAQASSEIPNAGGLLADIVGDNELGTFASQFPILGTGLKEFLTNVGTFSDDQVATVTCAANAIKTLASASKEIPNTGGWLAQIVGDNALGDFASQFPILGEGLAGFAEKLGTFSDDQVATVTCAANAVKTLASVAKEVPNTGGWLAQIVGEQSLGTFSTELPKLGTGLAGFVKKLGTFTSGQVATVDSAVAAVKSFTGLANADLKGAKKQMEGFGEKMVEFAGKIKEFASEMSGVGSRDLTMAISAVKQIRNLLGDLVGTDAKAADNFKKALKSLGESGVSKFVEAFTGSAAVKDISDAGVKMVQKLVEGANSKKASLEKTVRAVANSALKELKTKALYNGFNDAGKYLVDGFASGISANSYKAEAKAKAMAQAAEKAAKKELEVNSPSKVFKRLGMSLPEGLAMGIDKLAWLVTGSAVAMSDSAIDCVSDTLSHIAKAVDSDLDINPTIRPTLDLSEVRAGAGGISDMLNFGAPVALTANVGAVSMSMSRRNQNGDSEVVSAINKLRKDIGKTGNTSYHINGLSYSGDAELDAAFKTIIRAAKMERRV